MKNSKKNEIYDFNEDLNSQKLILLSIECKKNTFKSKPLFYNLIKKIPAELAEILRLEILGGNSVATISATDWPHKGSIVVNLRNRFKNTYEIKYPQVEFSGLNDPHYWHEQITQTSNKIDYLLIA